MSNYETRDFDKFGISIAMTQDIDRELRQHFGKPRQEDLTFAYWKPSSGTARYTAIIQTLNLPFEDERLLHGNASFTSAYVSRVLDDCPDGAGIAFLHGHLGPGWQEMSEEDVVAERDRLAGVVCSATGLPLIGLTSGIDGSWSGRAWLRTAPGTYERRWARTVRCVGRRLHQSFHPQLASAPEARAAQAATISVWGERAQQDIARTHVGVVGLGSVGSIVAEALSRIGVQHLTFIDPDVIEERNLDRTLGAVPADVGMNSSKVEGARRLVDSSHTGEPFSATALVLPLMHVGAVAAVLDCDVIFSCVDRPWPRYLMNTLAYAHLIPVIDGGILARVDGSGQLQHVDWRIHTVGPDRACLFCLGTLWRSDVALDRDGMLDDPDYIRGLSRAERERYGRRNVFAFSLSVASHEVMQFVRLVTGQERVGGIGPQTYHAYPGSMEVVETTRCSGDCDVDPLIASALSLPV